MEKKEKGSGVFENDSRPLFINRRLSRVEALTRPEHLADLEFRLAYFGFGAEMNDRAAAVIRKAIEVCRARSAG